MKTRYLVKWKTYSKVFNEEYIAQQTTLNLEKFLKTHNNVVEIWEVKHVNKNTYEEMKRIK